ncbi:hypothetical protein SCOR_28700 [Sulfidibacter corallicola]
MPVRLFLHLLAPALRALPADAGTSQPSQLRM